MTMTARQLIEELNKLTEEEKDKQVSFAVNDIIYDAGNVVLDNPMYIILEC